MKPSILYKGWVNIYFHNGDFITDGKIHLTKDIAKNHKDKEMFYVASKRISWNY